MNVTVIGAGPAGLAAAGHMAHKGHKVTLWNRSLEKIKALKEIGTIIMEGVINDTVQLINITTDLEEAVKGADFLSLMVTSDAYESIATKMAPYLENGQRVLLNCGGVGGSLLFQKTLHGAGYHPKITVGETDNTTYVARSPGVGKVLISGIKSKNYFTALPLNQAQGFLDAIHDVYPQFQLIEDPLSVGLRNVNGTLHSTGIVLNAERIRRKESFNFYVEGITPEIAHYMEMQDKERVTVAQRLGVRTQTVIQWLHSVYDTPMADLYTVIQNNKPYKTDLPAPTTFQHRYILEDVSSKLIPQLDIARIMGIPQPLTTDIVNKACELAGVDFFAIGRTVEKLGLTEEDILHYSQQNNAPCLEKLRYAG